MPGVSGRARSLSRRLEFHSTPSVDLNYVPWENTKEGAPLSVLQGVSFLVPLHGTKTFPAEAFFQSYVKQAYNFHPDDFNDARLQHFFNIGEVIAGLAFAAGGPVTVIPAAILSAAGSSGNMLEFIVSLGAKGFGFGAAKATLRGFNLDQAAKQAASRTGVALKNIDQHQIYRAAVVVFEQMLSKFYEEMGEWMIGEVTDSSKEEK